jgi:mono/diheme cytochrome c family protein
MHAKPKMRAMRHSKRGGLGVSGLRIRCGGSSQARDPVHFRVAMYYSVPMMRIPGSSLATALASLCLLLLGAESARGDAAEPAGKPLYVQYCASCHGLAGRGDGPVASSMRQPPPDLTTLAQRSGGRFDEREAMAVIDGARLVAAHGPREMPVWGAVFDKELEEAPFGARVRLLRAQVLADYLRTLQR